MVAHGVPPFPPGRKPGVKRDRPSKIMDRCDSVRTQIELIKPQYWDEIADTRFHQSRRSRFRYTLDQNGFGSCAGESATGHKAACDARQGLPLVVYNGLFPYHTTSGGRDNGSVIGENVEFIREHGVCPEEVWPRSKGFRAEPSAEAKRVAEFFKLIDFFYVETIDEFVSALLQGFDIHAGYTGHAIVFNRYLKRRTVEYKNSWGNWGDNGFGSLSLSKIHFPYGAYAYKNVRIFTPDEWTPKTDQRRLATAVSSFMEAMHETRDTLPWSKQWDQWREDIYGKSMEACGIAI